MMTYKFINAGSCYQLSILYCRAPYIKIKNLCIHVVHEKLHQQISEN